MWDAIAHLTTPFALAAFVAAVIVTAVIVTAVRALINRDRGLIEVARKAGLTENPVVPRVLDRILRRVRIEGLDRTQKLKIAHVELKSESRKFLMSAIVIVLLAIIAALAQAASTPDASIIPNSPDSVDLDALHQVVISPDSKQEWTVPKGVTWCIFKGVGGGGGGGSNGFHGGPGGNTYFSYDGHVKELICEGANGADSYVGGSGPHQISGGSGSGNGPSNGQNSENYQGGEAGRDMPGYPASWNGAGGGASSFANGGRGGSHNYGNGSTGGIGAGGGGGTCVMNNALGGGGGAGCQTKMRLLAVQEGKVIKFELGAGGTPGSALAGVCNSGGSGGPGEVVIYYPNSDASNPTSLASVQPANQTNATPQANATPQVDATPHGDAIPALTFAEETGLFIGLLIFLIGAFIWGGVLNEVRRNILRFVTAICGAFSAALIAGSTYFNLTQQVGGANIAISGTLGFALFLVIWFFFPKSGPSASSAFNFNIPDNCTFRDAADAIAQQNKGFVEFIGFESKELRLPLRGREIHAKSPLEAIQNLRFLVRPPKKIAEYEVQLQSATYRLIVKR